jgi:hypothetical protein
LLEIAATLTQEMKLYDIGSSFRDANTLLQRQQINGQLKKSEIKGVTRDADQKRSKQQIQRGIRSAPRHNVRGSEYIVNRDCSDD